MHDKADSAVADETLLRTVVDFEAILDMIDGFGRWQRGILVVILTSCYVRSLASETIYFWKYAPAFRCRPVDLWNVTSEWMDGVMFVSNFTAYCGAFVPM